MKRFVTFGLVKQPSDPYYFTIYGASDLDSKPYYSVVVKFGWN